jgi:hypothetical protein
MFLLLYSVTQVMVYWKLGFAHGPERPMVPPSPVQGTVGGAALGAGLHRGKPPTGLHRGREEHGD